MPDRLNSAKASVDSGRPPDASLSSNMSYVHSSKRERAESTWGADGRGQGAGGRGGDQAVSSVSYVRSSTGARDRADITCM